MNPKERIQNLEELAYVVEQFQEEGLRNENSEEHLRSENSEEGLKNKSSKENNALYGVSVGAQVNLSSFLEKMALVSSEGRRNENSSSISLMTLHVAKGLEFLNVFITGLEEGFLPSIYNWGSAKKEELEEERRLLYVGMTRAKKNLFFSFAKERKRCGRDEPRFPSPFLDEIPEEFLETEEKKNHQSSLSYGYNQNSPSFSFPTPSPPSFSKDSFGEGMKVRHPTFGLGVISKIEGLGKKKKVSINFRSSLEIKRFMANSPFISKVYDK